MKKPIFPAVLLSLTYTYFVPFSSFSMIFFEIVVIDDLEIIGFIPYIISVF